MKRIYIIAFLSLLVIGANRYLYGSNTVDPSDEIFLENETTENAYINTDEDATDGSIGFQVGAKAHAEDGQTKTVKKSGSFDFEVTEKKDLNLNIFIDGRLGGSGDYLSRISVDVSVKDSSDKTVIDYHYEKTKPDQTTTDNEPVVESNAFTAHPGHYTFNFELELYAKANDDDSRATANFMKASLFTLGDTTNQPPVARAKADKTVELGKSVEFDGSESYDPEGGTLTFTWDFDGGTGSGEKTKHSYSSLGTYTVTLTVTDETSMSSTDDLTITVKDAVSDENDDDDDDDDSDDDDSDDDDSDDDDDDDSDDDDDDKDKEDDDDD